MAEIVENGKVLARIEAVDGRLVVLGPDGEPSLLNDAAPLRALLRLISTPTSGEVTGSSPLNVDSDDIDLPLPELRPGGLPAEGTKLRRGSLTFERVLDFWVTHLPPEQADRDDWPNPADMVRAAYDEYHERLHNLWQ